jgi:hypothetical protein
MTTDADRAWDDAREELVPSVGERVADLLAEALLAGAASSGSAVAAQRAEELRAALRAQGDDPAAPQVTEVEGLLLSWARAAGAGDPIPSETAERLAGSVSTILRERLDALAAATRAL